MVFAEIFQQRLRHPQPAPSYAQPDIRLVGTVKIGSGLVNVVVTGDVSAVRAAIEAGRQAAEMVGEVYATHVIPQPDDAITKILPSFY